MFRGISQASIDVKGRLGLPSRFREAISGTGADNLVVSIDVQDRCLLVYPTHEWELVQRKLEALSNVSQKNRILQRLLIGHATDVEIDKSGRILLPSIHRKYAFLHKKATILGQGNKLEIWSENEWQERMTNWLKEKDKLLGFSGDLETRITI